MKEKIEDIKKRNIEMMPSRIQNIELLVGEMRNELQISKFIIVVQFTVLITLLIRAIF